MVVAVSTRAFRLLVLSVAAVVAMVGIGALPQSPAHAATLTDEVTVVMAIPAGGTQDSTTLQQVVDAVNGPVADYWSSTTGGAIRLGVTGQVDWYQASTGCAQMTALFADAAHQAGWSQAAGKHLMVYVPAGSAYCGLGGSSHGSLRSGGEVLVTDLSTSLIAEAFGYDFGLLGSSAVQCDGAVDSGTCQTVAKGDYYGVMGHPWPQLGSLNVAQAARLGVLPATAIRSVTTSDAPVTVTLSAVSGTTGIRAVQLHMPNAIDFWLEYRPASGLDSWLNTAADTQGLDAGVLLHRASYDGSSTSLLYDGTPSSAANWSTDTHAALPIGSPVTFAGGTYTVTVTGENASDAAVLITPTTPISVAYAGYGGATGPLGSATAGETCTSWYCVRTYQHGNIYWSQYTGAYAVQSDILSGYLAFRGPDGDIGLPVQNAACGLVNGGCKQQFQSGAMFASPATSPLPVEGGILQAYNAQGAQGGWLGYPTVGQVCGLVNGGCYQAFQHGLIYTSPASGAHPVNGALQAAWYAAGGESGWLGYPTSDAICALVQGGCKQTFQTGIEYWSPSTGAHPLNGGLRAAWDAMGSENGWLGYPTSNAVCGLAQGGCKQTFQTGAEYWSPATGTHPVNGALRSAWNSTGAESGWLGYPTSDAICGLIRGGCLQIFQTGVEYWSPASGTHPVNGAIRSAWAATGSEKGPLGYPTTDARCDRTGCLQGFQSGSLFWSSATGRVTRR